MSRFLCSVMVVVAGMALMAAPASAAPDEDFVVGNGGIVVDTPIFGPLRFDYFIDAHSDASGENPSGSVTFFFTTAGFVTFSGPVTCLEVTGYTAIIGFDDPDAGHLTIEVVDNSVTGSPDTVTAPEFDAVGCSLASSTSFPLVSGDFVVHDAVPLTSKGQCKDGGWRDFTDDQGHPFENQGDCVAFVEHAT